MIEWGVLLHNHVGGCLWSCLPKNKDNKKPCVQNSIIAFHTACLLGANDEGGSKQI